MERRTDVEAHGASRAGLPGRLHGPLHRSAVSRDDDLARRVEVGRRHDFAVCLLCACALDLVGFETEHSGHGANADRNCLLHETTPRANGTERILEAQASRGHVSRVLAQAVARRGGDTQSDRFHGAEGGHADRQDRGLCVLGQGQLLVGSLETEARDGVREDLVGGLETGCRLRKPLGQRAPHAGVLCSLTRKEQGDRRHQRTTDAAQVNPAPKAAINTMLPGRIFPAFTPSSSTIGIEADEVFP